MDALTKLITFLKNWWVAIKDNSYSVKIENIEDFPEYPEIPEVVIPEYPTEIKITNLEEIKPIDKFADIVKAIERQNKELKPQDKNVVGELKAILKELKKEKQDQTPEVVKKISELIKSVDTKSIDFSVLENQITELYGLLYSVKEYDEIKVKLNGKQFEKLAKKTAQAIAVGGSTGQYDKLISDDINNLVGLEIPPHDYIALSYTGSNLTGVVYKEGGVSGTTVATLTLGYDGSDNLTSVAKT